MISNIYKYSIILSTLCLLVCSCKPKRFEIEYIQLRNSHILKGKVVLPAINNSNYYEVQVKDDLYAILDFYSDTAMYIYSQNTNELIDFQLRINSSLTPFFIKENIFSPQNKIELYNAESNRIYSYVYEKSEVISKNKIYIYRVFSTLETLPLFVNITKGQNGIYGVPRYAPYISTFYYYEANEYAWFAEPCLTVYNNPISLPFAYICLPIVNEKKEVIFTASRFTNTIHKYNLNGDLSQLLILGEECFQPEVKDGKIDNETNIQYFIGAEGTQQAFYLLYKGTSLYDERQSYILKFNWDGKLQNVYEADRHLISISVDKDDRFIMGISRTPQGTEIVKYVL